MTEVRIEMGRVELPSGEWGVVPEQNRRERGHTFYPPFEDLAKIPALYATDGQAVEEKTIYLHYFTGGSDWYIAELDPKTGVAFGWARVNYPSGEWGYVNLIELEELCIAPRAVSQGGRLVGIYPQILVERDLHFTPTLARDCLPDDY
ncbi:hypothetical protein ABUW04_31965 [Streptacidiphilus sp. N1-10]|uniref:DUF2958 domain-containing protein n=1 Tax=Streptacidiphilus jeojiensis TaxID=3229225 RepID=A0ABV6XX75_9ACTN